MSRKATGLTADQRAKALGLVKGKPVAGPRADSSKDRSNAGSPSFTSLPGYKEREALRGLADAYGVGNPSFRRHAGRPGPTTVIQGREVLNFGSYDYVGLNQDPRPAAAAKTAIDTYGVSASASRLTAGERPVHAALEAALARHYGVEDALSFVSGHGTNVSVIATLTGKSDLILYDAYMHNSAVVGTELSKATRKSFPHNDLDALEAMLDESAVQHRAVLVLVEGHYSMDGDHPDMDRLAELKRRYGFWLLVDEAHGLGCIGDRGGGMRDKFDLPSDAVDIWMGTLSKSLASTGGYIAGSHALIDIMKYEAPGSVYSVALAPALAAAALASLEILEAEPDRVAKLHSNGRHFLKCARRHGLDTGLSVGSSIVPIIVGDAAIAVRLSEALLGAGINALPIAFPGVPLGEARLRFFLTSEHSHYQIERAVDETAKLLGKIRSQPINHLVDGDFLR